MASSTFSRITNPAVRFVLTHKVLSIVAALALIGAGMGAWRALHPASGAGQYVLSKVTKGTIVTSVTGSGQVSATNQLDVKAQASGNIIEVPVQNGQYVSAGAVLARIDSTNAQKTVRDAQVGLQNEQLNLARLLGPSGLPIPRNKQDAIDALNTAYADSFNTVSNAFLDFPSVMTGMQQLLLGNDFSQSQWNIDWYQSAVQTYDTSVKQYRDDAYAKYDAARTQYTATFAEYKATGLNAATSTVATLLNDTYTTAQDIAESVKSMNNLVQFYEDTMNKYNVKINVTANTQLATLNTYTGKVNTDMSNLQTMQTTLKSDTDAVSNADLDIQAEQLAIQQKQNALLDAQQNLANYVVRAPFDGVVANVAVQVADPVGSGTVVATMITQKKLATISLNEIDAAKVQVGQKATLTFDAVDGLSIAGQVSQIDSIGTVSQGVVTYNVTIQFDTQDQRVKPGMSVNAAIITNVKQDVLIVPNGAVKAQGTVSYVQMLSTQPVANGSQTTMTVTSADPLVAQQVQTGLSNDTMTEITSGIQEGDWVVTRTITQSGQSSSGTQAPSILGGGRPGGGGGFIRVGGGG